MEIEYRVWHANDCIWSGMYEDSPSSYREAVYDAREIVEATRMLEEYAGDRLRIQICQGNQDVTGSYGFGWGWE